MDILIDSHVDFDIEAHKKNINNVVSQVISLESFTENIEVSIVFVDNDEIQKINKRYRNIDKATDVLSFPLLEVFEIEEIIDSNNNEEVILLGDIIISVDKVFQQSKEYCHSTEREVAFLVAHSMLHLLGYDHMEEDEEKVMIEKQKIIMEKVNISR